MGRNMVTLLVLLGMSAPLLAASQSGVMLNYMVSESGLEPYASRIIITDSMVRMDDGEAAGDYLLFDRQQRLISSVTHGDGTVLEIPYRKVTQTPPMELQPRTELIPDEQAPTIAGLRPQQLRLYINDTLCYDAVVVPGLMADAVAALRDFNAVLAGEQGKLLSRLPADEQDGCDLALHTFYPQWSLQAGLPIQESDITLGRGRLLVDYQVGVAFDAGLFVLPEGYRHYQTE